MKAEWLAFALVVHWVDLMAVEKVEKRGLKLADGKAE